MDPQLQKIQKRLTALSQKKIDARLVERGSAKRYFIRRSDLLNALEKKKHAIDEQFISSKRPVKNGKDVVLHYLELVKRLKRVKHQHKNKEYLVNLLYQFKGKLRSA